MFHPSLEELEADSEELLVEGSSAPLFRKMKKQREQAAKKDLDVREKVAQKGIDARAP